MSSIYDLEMTSITVAISRVAAGHIMGQVVRYEVGNVYDPAYTMVCRIPKKWLPNK